MKSGKTMVALRVAGHRKFLQRMGQCAQYGRKKIPAQVLPDLQGNGLVRQRSISTGLDFLLPFVSRQK
nr:hypothetical protein [Mucilaginibacter sp. X5P1]MBB6141261.1 hypothetical protein [Mucilaginibacter sp. X5P1]